MRKEIRRGIEIVVGLFCLSCGLIMIITPGPGLLVLGLGILLISPKYGLKLIHQLEKFWWWLVAKIPAKWHHPRLKGQIPRAWAKRMQAKMRQWRK